MRNNVQYQRFPLKRTQITMVNFRSLRGLRLQFAVKISRATAKRSGRLAAPQRRRYENKLEKLICLPA